VSASPDKPEKIKYFRDPFQLVPLIDIASVADIFSRNEILTANEIRGYMGIPPATDPKADELTNSNMPQPALSQPTTSEPVPTAADVWSE
jgi:hypothetical protein